MVATLTVKTLLTDWGANGGSDTDIVVTLNPTTCSCTAMAWTAPSAVVATINIDATGTPTVPAPVSDTSARSSNA